MNIAVATFYQFCQLGPLPELREELILLMEALDLRGSILLAPEGINATIAGPQVGVDKLLDRLGQFAELRNLVIKTSFCEVHPFRRAKVRLKKESISFGQGHSDSDPTGVNVVPRDWNKLISQTDTLVLDTRNRYEIELGTFERARNPNVRKFKDLAQYVEQHLDPNEFPKIATFCTGGIRCEKFTSFLLKKGFKEVFQLQGGILKYLEEIPEEESLWVGHCFVFDERVGVSHGLKPMAPIR
ncbi:MAG: rhodanese-like domain-containing protein [Gemmataceae bacterium]|nr:hypothetical protein [Gemmataceae bacterium]